MQFDLVGLCLNFLSLSTYYEQYANLDKNCPNFDKYVLHSYSVNSTVNQGFWKFSVLVVLFHQ